MSGLQRSAETAAMYILVRGLGHMPRRKGVAIYEKTPVLGLAPGGGRTARGEVAANVVLRATEGYTGTLAGHARRMLPVYTMMVATEPPAPER